MKSGEQKILEITEILNDVQYVGPTGYHIPVSSLFRKNDKHPLKKVIFELYEFILETQQHAYHEGYCDMAREIKEILEDK